MDKIIANGKQLKQRQLIAGFLTAVACGAGVYLFHVPFHTLLLDALGTSSRIADSVGSFSIVFISVAVNNIISLVIFKDISLGLRAVKPQIEQNASCDEVIVNGVTGNLGGLPYSQENCNV